MGNINRSQEVIDNLRNTEGSVAAYPMAFGFCWAILSNEARAMVLEWAEKKANEKEGN